METSGHLGRLAAGAEQETDDVMFHLSGDPGAPFTLAGRMRSFRFAARGVRLMLRSQHNAWLHAVASCCVLTASGLFVLSAWEWCFIVLAIMAVWTAEALNTALEFLADVASPEFHPLVGKAKDVAAGGVLIAACGATAIGLLVLGPHFLKLLATPQ